jgi:hypothetical protein
MTLNFLNKRLMNLFLNLIIFSPIVFLISSSIIFLLGIVFNIPFVLSLIFPLYLVFSSLVFYLLYVSKIFEEKLLRSVFLVFIFLFQFLVFSLSFRNSLFPHHAHDASNHAFMVKRILDTKRVNTEILKIDVPYEEFFKNIGEGTPYYPLGFHTGAAFLCDFFHKDHCLRMPWYLSWIYASTVPVLIYFWASLFFGYRVAIISTFFVTIFYLFPYMPFGWGGFAQISGLMLLLFSLIFWTKFFKTKKTINLILALIGSCATFYTHTTDFLTLGLTVLITNLPALLSIVIKLDLAMIKKLLIALVALFVLIYPAFNLGHQASQVKLEYPPDFPFNLNDFNFLYKYHLIDVNNNILTFAFFFIGFFAMFRQEKSNFYPFFNGFVFFFLLVVFLRYWSLFQKLTAYFYPWGMFERIMYTLFIFYPVIAGVGAEWFFKNLNRIGKIILIFVSLILFLNSLYLTGKFIKYLNNQLNPVTVDDIVAFNYINSNKDKFKNKIFYNNPFNDAGAWLYEATGVKTYFPTASSAGLTNQGKKFLYIFYEKNPEEICLALKKYKTDYLFIGSKIIDGTDRFFLDEKIDNMKCITKIFEKGKTKIYQVVK